VVSTRTRKNAARRTGKRIACSTRDSEIWGFGDSGMQIRGCRFGMQIRDADSGCRFGMQIRDADSGLQIRDADSGMQIRGCRFGDAVKGAT